jgi:hypothetical protein
MDQPAAGDLDGLFEDLEQQAAGIQLTERDAELADRARGEYAAVTLAGRVHASLGLEVALTLLDAEVVEGVLSDAGPDWCAVTSAGQGGWLVRLAAVATMRGMSLRSVPDAARPVTARLGFGSALHRAAADGHELAVHTRSGATLRGRLVRCGADFLELAPAGDVAGVGQDPWLVPLPAVRAVRVG